MNKAIDDFLKDGCGRCSYYKSPQCKVIRWQNLLIQLRPIILATGLTEEVKWSQPCYTYEGRNVLILSAFKNYAFISFLKGALLQDPVRILITPGKHSQADRRMYFSEANEIIKQENEEHPHVKEFLEAIADIP